MIITPSQQNDEPSDHQSSPSASDEYAPSEHEKRDGSLSPFVEDHQPVINQHWTMLAARDNSRELESF